MEKIVAIAFLQVRAAIRSKLFVSLMGVLVLALIGLPATIKGDGTLMGQIKVLLYYTLGLTTIILGVATLWAASGAISQEVESRQIQLVVVKPVHHFQIWFGKWLGLLAMNAALLCLTGLIMWGLVQWTMRSSGVSKQERRMVREELLAGRELFRPHDTLQQDTLDRYNDLLRKGALSADFPRAEALLAIKKEFLAEKTVVKPSSAKQWFIEMPDGLSGVAGGDTAEVMLKIQFTPVRAGTNPVSGRWSVGTEHEPDIYSMTTNNTMDGLYRITIPVDPALVQKVISEPGRKLVVDYKNDDDTKSRSVIFDRTSGVELYIRQSGFESNLVRALLIVLCRIALLAALGLTASTMFSFPVATFTSFAILMISFLTHYFIFLSEMEGHVHDSGEAKESYWHVASDKAVRKLNAAFEPVMEIKAVSPLSDGVLVSWNDVGKAVLISAVLYSGLLGVVGILLFRRRELALPYT
mgnify:CR=1 FL=1